MFPRRDVFSDILLLFKVVQHRSAIVTFYLLNVLCKSRLVFRVFVKVLFEEQRDSRVWVCCVLWKLFASDTLLIKSVDLSSSYLSKAFFLAHKDISSPRQ